MPGSDLLGSTAIVFGRVSVGDLSMLRFVPACSDLLVGPHRRSPASTIALLGGIDHPLSALIAGRRVGAMDSFRRYVGAVRGPYADIVRGVGVDELPASSFHLFKRRCTCSHHSFSREAPLPLP